MKLEIFWSAVPLFVFLSMFAWGAKVYFDYFTVDPERDRHLRRRQAVDVENPVPGGAAEINELHVPVGRPVKLTMASEDVIHSFFVPAFRIKRDVVPGHYNTMTFTPTKKGRYHIFCAEYCGTQHSGMIGWVTVMDPAEYENWLQGGGGIGLDGQPGREDVSATRLLTCHCWTSRAAARTCGTCTGTPCDWTTVER